MLNFIIVAKALLDLFPLVIQAVKTVEEALPEGGQGEKKLELVRQTLEGAYDAVDDLPVSFTEVWPSVQNIIGTVVSIYNATGAFKK